MVDSGVHFFEQRSASCMQHQLLGTFCLQGTLAVRYKGLLNEHPIQDVANCRPALLRLVGDSTRPSIPATRMRRTIPDVLGTLHGHMHVVPQSRWLVW
jgi:hypothetical protein